MDILAHRANLDGPSPEKENRQETVAAALEEGFGIETDLRRDGAGRFYLAHDASGWTRENDFRNFSILFREHPDQTVAMNVKELGYESELVALQQAGALGNRGFYFDFELLEPDRPGAAQHAIRALPGGASTRLAARLSDRGETLARCLAIPSEIVWADEFDALWLSAEVVAAAQAAGRLLYAISPELHGFDKHARLRRWRDFKAWGIDGLCTDHPLAARDIFCG
jgi:glycerophosphoryl diester phosphodiesterase